MNGNIINSKGDHVGMVIGAEIFDLDGHKLYDLKGANIYRLSGELIGHFNNATASEFLATETYFLCMKRPVAA